MKYSIIIPTYNKCDEFLKPCIESIIKYTTLEDIELIISANGCVDHTKDYLEQLRSHFALSGLSHRFKVVWDDHPLGYPRAINKGIQVAIADKIVLLNNDCVLLPQNTNDWLNILQSAFDNHPNCGVSCNTKIFSEAANTEFAIFYCVMIDKKLFDQIGLLNEEYGLGMGEDIEFCIKAQQAGYSIIQPIESTYSISHGFWVNSFPIQHFAEGTMHDHNLVADYSSHYNHNLLLLAKKFNQDWYNRYNSSDFKHNHIKYSIVIPTYNHCDDLLKPCIDSILNNTFLTNVEIIVVANGCTDNTSDYLNFLHTTFASKGLCDNLRIHQSTDALGYTVATNIGIKMARGEFIILMNNDVQLLSQPKSHWLDLLEEPFKMNTKVGLTGPVKFDWMCGRAAYQAIAFWLVMIKRQVFDSIGILDEIYNPGMGEDGDFCIRAALHGFELVGVPNNVSNDFNKGILDFSFPIYHVGNGTFNDDDSHKQMIIERNNAILLNKYGDGQNIEISIIIPTAHNFSNALKPCIEALLRYTSLQNKEIIVVANGSPQEAKDFLDSHSGSLKYIWFPEKTGVVRAYNSGIELATGKFIVTLDDDSILMTQNVDYWLDLLKEPFINDPLVGASSPFAHEYDGLGLLLHSGCTMYRKDLLDRLGGFDEAFNPGYFCDPDISMRIWEAGFKCVEVPQYNNDKPYINGVFSVQFPVVHLGDVQTMNKDRDIEIVRKNRELLYKKHMKTTKYSIIIPSYNHCDDLLAPCIESIKKYTDLSDVEIIVVANGCTDNTREYVQSQSDNIKLLWFDDAIGYTRAINRGIEASTGEYVVLLNNDTELLPQMTNTWLDMLSSLFHDESVGLAGPLMLHDDYSNHNVLIFFCVMIRKAVFEKIGLLDEIYSPGGGEDIDFSIRAVDAGYTIRTFDDVHYSHDASTNVGEFPIWHKDNKTFVEIPEYTNKIVKDNGLLNCKRYNKNIKLNLGAGGVEYPGYLSVDLYDSRANIIMDITNLDFDENSVTEILASHVFEHLNPYHALDILKNWLRVLKPGGRLIMEMPDIEELCRRFVNADTGTRYGILNAVYGSVNTTGVGGPDNITSPHLFGWWPQSIFDHLSNAGYTDIRFMNEQIPHPESNFRVEANKPMGRWIDHTSLKSQELCTYIEIFEHNTYQVLNEEIAGKTVIDIGANVGLFSLMCVEKGAEHIIAVEAQPVIYNLGLIPNTARYPMITPLNYAVFSEDNRVVNIINHHVGSKLSIEGDQVHTKTLKSLIKNVKGNDLVLKLDCEGSEFDILLSCDEPTISRFETIYIEIHGDCNMNPAYHDVNLVRNWLDTHQFQRISSIESFGFTEPEPTPMNIFVEKWRRVPNTKLLRWLEPTSPDTYSEVITSNCYFASKEMLHDRNVLDIGANAGMFSILSDFYGAKKVIAVEPVSATFETLTSNIIVSQAKNIIPIQKLVSNYSEPQSIGINEHSGANSMYKVHDISETVGTISLSSLLDMFDGDNIFLKIDCEGAEYDIILNATTEQLNRVSNVAIEIHEDLHPSFKGRDIIMNKLIDNGFHLLDHKQVFYYEYDPYGNPCNHRDLPFVIQFWGR